MKPTDSSITFCRRGQKESPLLRELMSEISTKSPTAFCKLCQDSWNRIIEEPLETFMYLPDLGLAKGQADLYSERFHQVGSLLVACGLTELSELRNRLQDEVYLGAVAFKYAFACASRRGDSIDVLREALSFLELTERGLNSRLANLVYRKLAQLYRADGKMDECQRFSLEAERTIDGPDLFDICRKLVPSQFLGSGT